MGLEGSKQGENLELLYMLALLLFWRKKQQTSLPGFHVKTVTKTGKFSPFSMCIHPVR